MQECSLVAGLMWVWMQMAANKAMFDDKVLEATRAKICEGRMAPGCFECLADHNPCVS